MDLSLFPKNEEWGTGDEDLDLRLANALKKTAEDLSLQLISNFYFLGMSLKPRAYNTALPMTIELVCKALLYHHDSNEYNDFLLKKIKGHYFQKEKIAFDLENSIGITTELKKNHKYRYKNQIDFSLTSQCVAERNPFVRFELKKSPFDLTSKIIFKEFKNFLNGELTKETYSDAFFIALKSQKNILVIENFAEIWYDNDQLFSITKIPSS